MSEMCAHCGELPATTEVLDDETLCEECAKKWALNNGYETANDNESTDQT